MRSMESLTWTQIKMYQFWRFELDLSVFDDQSTEFVVLKPVHQNLLVFFISLIVEN